VSSEAYTIMKFNRRIKQRLLYVFTLVVRLGLGCLFLWSSLPEIRQPYDFLSNVYYYRLVGPKLGILTAMTLPCLELLVSLCLLGGIFVSGSLLASIGMAGMFTFVLSWALYQELEIGCGCFGSSTELISYSILIRALGILLISITAYLGVVLLKGSEDDDDKCPGECNICAGGIGGGCL